MNKVEILYDDCLTLNPALTLTYTGEKVFDIEGHEWADLSGFFEGEVNPSGAVYHIAIWISDDEEANKSVPEAGGPFPTIDDVIRELSVQLNERKMIGKICISVQE
jgi:hypothetical protein